MKRLTAFTLLLILTHSAFAQVEIGIPECPRKVEFADVIVNLDAPTQKEVNKEITSLLTPQNSFLDAKLERMQWYFPIIESILEDENLPDDLKFISAMESSLIPDALSTSGAVGYWQFKEPTAKELGLRIDREVDERKNIYESTRAAALYFKRNNLIFKNWLSCMYAYYQGPTGAASKIPDEWSYASEVDFTQDTPKYLIRALAHRVAFEHRLNRLKSSESQFVQYPTKGKSLAQIASELTVDISQLRKYNSWLLAPAIPEDKTYIVLIPALKSQVPEIIEKMGSEKTFASKQSGFPVLSKLPADPKNPEQVAYEINGKKGAIAQPGDEAAQIARSGGVKLLNFLKFNDMSDRDIVKVGQPYYFQKKSKKAAVPFHTVRKDQTIWEIAQIYGVQVKSILKFNRMRSLQKLQPGRVMWLQKKRPKNQPIEIIRIPEDETTEEPIIPPVVEDYNNTTETEEVDTAPMVEETTAPVIVKEENSEPLIKSKPQPPKVLVLEEPETEVKKPAKKVVVIEEEYEPKDTASTSPATDNKSNYGRTHRVKRGETLFSLANQYGVTVAQLRAWNGMSSRDVLQYDQVLKLSDSSVSSIPREANTQGHLVKKGETLYSISKMYGMTVAQLKSLNGLKDNTISVNQRLRVNGKPQSQAPQSHTVSKGETLYSISQKYNLTVAKLKSMNGLRNNTISVGQRLRIQ